MVVASYHDLLYQKKNSSISPTFLDWRTDIILHLAYFITCTTDHIYIYIYAKRFLCTPIPSWGQMFLLRPCPVLPSNRCGCTTESDLTSDSELTCPGDQFLDGSWNMRPSPFSTTKNGGTCDIFHVKHEIFTIFVFQLSILKLDLVWKKRMSSLDPILLLLHEGFLFSTGTKAFLDRHWTTLVFFHPPSVAMPREHWDETRYETRRRQLQW